MTDYGKMVNELPALTDKELEKLSNSCWELIAARAEMARQLKQRDSYITEINSITREALRKGFGFSLTDQHGDCICINPNDKYAFNFFISTYGKQQH